MQLSVKHEWLIVPGVIFGGQVALFFRTVWRPTFARIMDPANDVIEIGLFANTLKIRRERTARRILGVADCVTSEAATSLKKVFAAGGIAARLLGKFAFSPTRWRFAAKVPPTGLSASPIE